VYLLDLSCGGALVQTRCRLLPGSEVTLHLGPNGRVVKRGRVQRCKVMALDPSLGVTYCAALVFDTVLTHEPGPADAGSVGLGPDDGLRP
jgi:hypothetical protein